MLRRWLIRILFLLPVLLIAAGWVLSEAYSSYILYGRSDDGYIGCSPDGGQLDLYFVWRGDMFGTGWQWQAFPVPFGTGSVDHPDFQSFLGFGYLSQVDAFAVGIPFWFLLLLSCALLFLVWLKTRPKPTPATAFPVEVAPDTKPTLPSP